MLCTPNYDLIAGVITGFRTGERPRSKYFARSLFVAAVALAGCQTPSTQKLAPLRTEVEHVPGGGARYLVLINGSSQDLHHCTFSAFLSDAHDPNPLLRLQPFARCSGTKNLWRSGEETRFECPDSHMEFPIIQSLGRVEVVGHCDEGSFRQSWRITASRDEPRPLSAKAQFSFVPGMPGSTNRTFTRR